MVSNSVNKILKMLLLLVLIYFTSLNAQIINHTINTANIEKHIQYLGSDICEGRGTGTKGGYLAAKYIAQEIEKMGLLPAGDNNSFYQNIPMHGSKPTLVSELNLYFADETIKLNFGNDYLLLKSGDQTYTPSPKELVFVSYGIIAPEYDYNDYQDINVEGKIVVFLEGEPISNDPNYFAGNKNTVYSYVESKRRIALSRGAAGSILIADINNEGESWESLSQNYLSENITLAYSVSGNLSLLLNPLKFDSLLKNSGYNSNDIQNMRLENSLKSFPLKTKLSFKGDFIRRDFIASNVAAIVEGSDPELKDTYLIISAHYDHLGIGIPVAGDSIYNGVMDNAIGSAAVLEIASVINSNKAKLKRSVLFLFTTGEENGLLGSQYYTSRPLVPLYKTVANINVDGIAVFDNFKSIIGVGSELSDLETILSDAAAEKNLGLSEIPELFISSESFERSDQISFASAGIPSMIIVEAPDYYNLSFEEGIQKFIDFSENVYHTPFDDLSLQINYHAVEQHVDLLIDVIQRICNRNNPIEWKPNSPFINARLRSIAEKR